MEQITEVIEQMNNLHKNSNNMEMRSDEKKGIAFPSDFPVQPIHPEKPIKEGVCPICRGDRIVKVFQNGVLHLAPCVCSEHKEQLQKCIDIAERVQKMLREDKEKESAHCEKSEEIKIEYVPIRPNIPIKEGVCPICRGVGVVKEIRNGVDEQRFGNCICVKKKIAMEQMQRAGVAETIEKYTFENFQTPEEWQKKLKQKALQFLNETKKWFFVGGQVGCGKTHICTAILADFVNRGKDIQYILWANEVVKLKANKMDAENYQKIINPILTAQVLYIDDFFKTEKDKKPSEADIRTAFEIINYRYVNENLITIISSEKAIDDLIEIDEAIGSRIYQKTKGYSNIIIWEEGRNWRLKKQK